MNKFEVLNNKLKSPEEIRSICNEIVLLTGCFDYLHVGHMNLILESKKYNGKTIVAINTDKYIKKLKGNNRPIVNQIDRAFSLASLYYVDYVTFIDSDVIDDVLEIIKPNYFIKGGDYSFEKLTKNEKEIIIRNNIKPIFIPLIKGYSTTILERKVKHT